MREKTVAIVGTSMFAKAVAVEFLRHGASVLFLDNQCFSSSITFQAEEGGIVTSFTCACTSDWRRIGDAIYVVTSQTGEELLQSAMKIASFMELGQLLVMFPGYFMAEPVARIFREIGNNNVSICEMTSSPVVCSMKADGIIHIHKRKKKLKYATYKSHTDIPALALLKDFLPMLSLASNTIETSLENINSILHPLPILLNLATVQRSPDTFRHFIDGVDEQVSCLMHLMDEERLAVGSSLGLELEPVLTQLKLYYGNNSARTIFEYIHTPECPYNEIRGFGLSSRYITLDVPNLVVNTARLAHANMVPVPLFDACIALANPFIANAEFPK